MVIGVAMALASAAVVLRTSEHAPGIGGEAGAQTAKASPLGNPGARIEVSGKLIEIQHDRKTLVIWKGTSASHWTILARMLDTDLSKLTPGRPTDVTGILTEIRPDNVFLVQGLTANQN
jgi:hypothetical protein